MTQLLVSPWAQGFDALVKAARASLVLCSPYIGEPVCRRMQDRSARSAIERLREVYVLTDLSLDNMLSGATDVTALLQLVETFPQTTVQVLPSLHAKVYVADTARAIVTSANLTEGGLRRNFEYGVLISNRVLVDRVRHDVLDYGRLGSRVGVDDLRVFSDTTMELRDMRRTAERSVRGALRREFARRLRAAEDEVLRVRAAGRTAHAIFADAVLHLLRTGPKRTEDIHRAVKAIHPDLCDDSQERIIDGKHFGKKWKHAVRTAQQHLKRRGRARYEHGLWRMCDQGATPS